jgi:Rrf2 family transcriptional regulator, cysteine metabolism repressor
MDMSARTMYGLRALVTMAGTRTDAPLSIQFIAERDNMPGKFLEGIMADLKRGGFVRSRRGASGGYFLCRPASEITLLEVIRHLDGPGAPSAYEDRFRGDQPTERQAAFRPVWQEIRDATIRILESYTIQSIADAVEESPLGEFHPIYQI